MAAIRCPNCDAPFDLAAVARFERFACARCNHVIDLNAEALRSSADLPRIEPDAGALSPPPPPPSTPPPAVRRPAAPTRPASRPAARKKPAQKKRRGPSRPAPKRKSDKRGGNPAVVGASIAGIVVVLALGAFVGMQSSKKPAAVPVAGGPAGTSTSGSPATGALTADPEQDPAAWKALPASDRKRRTDQMLGDLDITRRSAVQWAFDFLKQRGEKDAVAALGRRALKQNPGAQWVYRELGWKDLGKRVDTGLEECPLAYDMDVEPVRELDRLRDEHSTNGKWWGDAATAKRVEELLGKVKDAEKELADPYQLGVRKWVEYQRSINIMRDYPSLFEAKGPYLVFAQVEAPPKTKLDQADPAARSRAKAVLEDMHRMVGTVHDALLAEFGKPLGFVRHGEKDTTHQTLLKVNVFPTHGAYAEYHKKIRSVAPLFGRAYYDFDEPRMLATYVERGKRTPLDERQVQCREAVKQLMHFYAWDAVRKKTGKSVLWSECRNRPMWSEDGFAEFFSALTALDNTLHFMQPNDERMSDLVLTAEVMRRKGWKPLTLAEMLGIPGHQELYALARKRVPDEAPLAYQAYALQLYARAWSLVYYLWSAERGGKPLLRDRYIAYLRREFDGALDETDALVPVTAMDFREALGIDTASKLPKFEREWKTFETRMVNRNRSSKWQARRAVWLPMFGLDPRKTK